MADQQKHTDAKEDKLMKKTVAVAGATGFIGRWFIEQYKDQYNIIALSRRSAKTKSANGVEWRQVDLYSISKTTEALRGADYALYLVHSMNKSTRLNQGNFEDTDLLLADNFARAAAANNIEQILFMGGILPKEDVEDMSTHLRSRYEVEQMLGARSAALTAIRAGIIIGPGGSSFNIVKKLVNRLPVMACPQWTESKTQPIALRDVLTIIERCLGNERFYHKAIEVGHPEIMTYREMLEETARIMGKKRIIFSLPFFTVGLSKLWVGYFSDSNAQLVSPLVESLRHTMIVEESEELKALDIDYQGFEEAVKFALDHERDVPPLPQFEYQKAEKNTVRSFQRLPNPHKATAQWVADRYRHWLPSFLGFFISAREDGDLLQFRLLGFKKPLLQLTLIAARSDKERQLFYISDGWLVKRKEYGWLEFRSVLDNRYFIAAIHEFVPRLPWYVYVNTQARVHLWVMNSFIRYLKNRAVKMGS